MAGTANALHGDCNGAGGADLADEIDVAYVDAEFERRCGDEDFYFAVFESLLSVEAKDAGERAVVSGYIFRTDAGSQFEGYFFDETASVDED
jgi:hypothetical protein